MIGSYLSMEKIKWTQATVQSPATSLHGSSACFNTVFVTLFCLSGGISTGMVSRDIREYQTEKVVLPYRGTIHDLGRAITHKKMIIGHFLKNIPTPDISRITDHTEEACDRYIKAYKKCEKPLW